MPTYNVHLYREMRLYFPDIEADTPEEAAKLVAEKDFDDVEDFSDCDGENLAALVDLVGDEEFRHSKTIAFDPVKEAAQELYEALCDMVSDRDDLSPVTIAFAKAALAKARGETLPEAA